MRWVFAGIVAAYGFFGANTYGKLDVDALRSSLHETFSGLRGSGGRLLTQDPVPPSAKYVTVPVRRGSVEDLITATGTLFPVETVDVGSQIPGEVTSLYVDFNDEVHVGQPLVQLDRRSYQAKLDEQSAGLASAKADLRLAQLKRERAKIALDVAIAGRSGLLAQLDRARAMKTNASAALDRQSALHAREISPLASLEAAKAEAASRVAAVAEARASLDMQKLSVDGAEAEVREAEAEIAKVETQVAGHEALVRAAKVDLDRTLIRSPIDGVIVGRFINRGQTLTENIETHPIFSIARSLDEMEVRTRIDETDIGRIKVGQRATFSVDAFPNRRFPAAVRQIRKAPEMTQNVVTYTVVLATENREGLLLPGMTALAKLTVDQASDVLKVPLAALSYQPSDTSTVVGTQRGDQSGAAVWVVSKENAVKKVEVRTGTADENAVAVVDGALTENDRVVVAEAQPPTGRRILGIKVGF